MGIGNSILVDYEADNSGELKREYCNLRVNKFIDYIIDKNEQLLDDFIEENRDEYGSFVCDEWAENQVDHADYLNDLRGDR